MSHIQLQFVLFARLSFCWRRACKINWINSEFAFCGSYITAPQFRRHAAQVFFCIKGKRKPYHSGGAELSERTCRTKEKTLCHYVCRAPIIIVSTAVCLSARRTTANTWATINNKSTVRIQNVITLALGRGNDEA